MYKSLRKGKLKQVQSNSWGWTGLLELGQVRQHKKTKYSKEPHERKLCLQVWGGDEEFIPIVLDHIACFLGGGREAGWN